MLHSSSSSNTWKAGSLSTSGWTAKSHLPRDKLSVNKRSCLVRRSLPGILSRLGVFSKLGPCLALRSIGGGRGQLHYTWSDMTIYGISVEHTLTFLRRWYSQTNPLLAATAAASALLYFRFARFGLDPAFLAFLESQWTNVKVFPGFMNEWVVTVDDDIFAFVYTMYWEH